jgi:hypothetical protein
MNSIARSTDYLAVIDEDLQYVKSKGTIYKYISASSGILILDNLGLKFNIPKNFNDPFDCDPSLISTSNNYNIELLKQIIKNPPYGLEPAVKRAIEEVVASGDFNNSPYYKNFKKISHEDLREKLLSNTKITCFSEEYNNMLLWSHYTKNQYGKDHTGICIGFHVDNLLDSLANSFVSMDLHGPFLRVKYDPKRINYEVDSPDDLLPLMMWLKTKSSCWEYENEIRLVLPKWVEQLDKSIIPISKDVISAVYLGVNVSKDDEIRIRETCSLKLPYAKLFRMHLSDIDYALLPKKI